METVMTISATLAMLSSLPRDMLIAYQEGVAQRYLDTLAEADNDTALLILNADTLNGVFASSILNRTLSLTSQKPRSIFEVSGDVTEKIENILSFHELDRKPHVFLLDIPFNTGLHDILAQQAEHVVWINTSVTEPTKLDQRHHDESKLSLLIDQKSTVVEKTLLLSKILTEAGVASLDFLNYSTALETAVSLMTSSLGDIPGSLASEVSTAVPKDWALALNSWFDLSPNAHSRLRRYAETPVQKTFFEFLEEGEHLAQARYHVTRKTIKENSVITTWTLHGEQTSVYRVAVMFHSDKLIGLKENLLNCYNGEAAFAIVVSLCHTGQLKLTIQASAGLDAMEIASHFDGQGDNTSAVAYLSLTQLSGLMSGLNIFK